MPENFVTVVKTNVFETPYLVLDRDIMDANIERMARRCEALGVGLRPHFKTPKSLPVAQALADAGATGFTVSTLKEAEGLFQAGFEDIFYAVPLCPTKVARAGRMLRDGHRLSLLIDTLEGAQKLELAAQAQGVVLPLWIEIDVDHYRTGIDFRSSQFEQLAKLVAAGKWTDFCGLMSYGGASYGCSSPEDVAVLTESHRMALLEAADLVQSWGIPRPRLSFGSTPAVLHAATLEGIDEVRCGIYVFQDLFQAGIGACQISDIALSVMATVISHSPELNRFTIDAGSLALSKDRSTQGRAFDAKFGLVCDSTSGQPIDDLLVSVVSQELGLVSSSASKKIDLSRFPIGSTVRILPNHADMTAAAYEDYVVHGKSVDSLIWGRRNGWE